MLNVVVRKLCARGLIVSVVVAAACCGSSAASAATRSPEAATHHAKKKAPVHKKKPKKLKLKLHAVGAGPLHGVVPAAQIAIFSSLEGPRATDVPRAIIRSLSIGIPNLEQLGIDYTEARRLDVANTHFYLVPGTRGICLFMTDGGSVCSSHLADLARYGLNVNLVPPPAGRVDLTSAPGTPGPVLILGVAPRGVTAVTVTTQTGETVTAQQAGEAYAGVTRSAIVSRTLTGPGLAPVSDPATAP